MRVMLAGIALAALLALQEPAAQRPSSSDQAPGKPERFAAILTAGPLAQNPSSIEIGVDRWSTDEMRAALSQLFRSGGQPALLEAMKRLGVSGYLRMTNRERGRLQAAYAQQVVRSDGGRRIVLLCVRYTGDWEVNGDSGWTEYLFRLVTISLDAKNRGTGTLYHAAKMSFGEDGPELERELSGQPTKLVSIQKVH